MIRILAALLLLPVLVCAVLLVVDDGDYCFEGGFSVSRLAGGFRFTEGPLWIPQENALFFSDLEFEDRCSALAEPCGAIYRVTLSAEVAVVREPSFNANGLALDGEGRLLAAEGTTHRVTRTGADGRVMVLADRFGEQRLNAPNDLVVSHDGSVYFTDPDLTVHPAHRELGFNGVYRVDPSDGEVELVTDRLYKPNGLALSPDGTTLYVSDIGTERVLAFTLGPDGRAASRQVFAEGLPGADGMTLGDDAHLYVATNAGIAVFTLQGEWRATLPIEDPATGRAVRPSNCAFGGPRGDILFVTAEDAVYRVEPTDD